jgi:glycogen synthase
MKIAFISYEYPPDTSVGGISTYVYQAANMMTSRGHHVEVFCGSTSSTSVEIQSGFIVHRVRVDIRKDFPKLIVESFIERHRMIKFDVLEGPDLGAEARYAVVQAPDIPFVVKLHTPRFLVDRFNYVAPSIKSRIRWYIGSLRRGRIPESIFKLDKYEKKEDIEYNHILQADEIAAPSNAIASLLVENWGLDRFKISLVPLPYICAQDLLDIPVSTETNIVSFIGRLEIRKGVFDFAKSIPLILKSHPKARFRFVGASWPSPQPNLDMRSYLQKKLKKYHKSLEFTGHVDSSLIPSFLANTDICVFPSIWESFGFVCAEAMSAGRGIVASNSGGMAELLDYGKVGRLVSPHSPQQIANAVIELLDNPTLRIELGQAARNRILSEYNLEKIGILQEASYLRAIEGRKALGERRVYD